MATESVQNIQDPQEKQRLYIERRNALLKDIDPVLIQKAWFTLAHLLLSDGDKVADMGCGDGAMTYAMAVLEPTVHFTGVDKSKRNINHANAQYDLDNLEFKSGDATDALFKPDSLDAIINSFTLHEIYSASKYNERIVRDTLETHFKMLKKQGMMFLRDYARPPPEEYVLMEMPDKASAGEKLSQLSEADLLVWYSEHARPRNDPGTGGFFLEEIPARYPKTRLFRLPYKWAYEFIMRKDDRDEWEKELPIEYTFYTPREFRKELRHLGARVQYAAPYWNEDYIKKHFEGHFRLYDDAGNPLGNPQTSYIIVAAKMGERKSLQIQERRPSRTDEGKLKINAMRDNETGQITDVVSRDDKYNEVLPYRIDENGRLKIYLHEGIARSIANTVPRNGVSIDDRRWSGHLVEPISVKSDLITPGDEFDVKKTVLFSRDYLGLKPALEATIKQGPEYYPAPDYIDEVIYTFYLEVQKSDKAINPKTTIDHTGRFQAKGQIREFDAQQVLSAIGVGLIPSARLELQILSLFNHLNLKPENWMRKQIAFTAGNIKQKTSLLDFLKNYQLDKGRFKDVKGSGGQLRQVNSIFVEEGQAKGSITGLSSQDMDFVVHNDNTINTAVVLPLSKDLKREVHAGFQLKKMPIPERHTGNANIVSAPRFNLPRHIKNLTEAKKYIADQYAILPEMVLKMGESYFEHIGMTQHRIHPFAVIVPPSKMSDPGTAFLPFYQMKLLRGFISKDTHFMITLARAYQYFHEDIQLDFKNRVSAIVKKQFEDARPEWSLPLNFAPAPLPIKPPLDDIVESPEVEKKPAPKASPAPISAPQTAPNTIQEDASAQAAPASPQEPSMPAQHKPDPNATMLNDFEKELKDAIEAIETAEKAQPHPEKW